MGSTFEGKINAVYFLDQLTEPKSNKGENFVRVDEWEPSCLEEVIVNCIPGYFVAPISVFNNISVDPGARFDYFVLPTKKCYNSVTMRQHMYQYLNYFCNFYDYEKEYLSVLFNLKIRIERYTDQQYPVEAFFYDLDRYIVRSSLVDKVKQMVEDNYYQELSYTNMKSPSLRYTNEHAKLLYTMSILMDLCIPLLTTYAYMHKVESIDEYLLLMYDKILHIDPKIDIYAKLYDTAYTNVSYNQKNNQVIWKKQDIRSIDVTTHSTDSVHNIILNIMPKYTFNKNIISFNFASIRQTTNFKITDISFEFSYISISSSKRDNDSISDFDKFESNLIRMNEGLYLQNKVNCYHTMKTIESQFGPFDPKEIELYEKAVLTDENGNLVINKFQKQLVFSMFYKYFRDTQSIHAISKIEYIKLMIAAKKILKSKNMLVLPYIISGKIDKLVQRKTVNKKERINVMASQTYPKLLDKYKDESIVNDILSILATIISSEFSIVDLDPTINGKRLDISATNIIIEEVEAYILMC